MRTAKTRDIVKALRRLGCVRIGAVGSHEKWEAPGGHSTIVKAGVKEQAPGTVRNIQAHLEPEFGPGWLEKELG